MFQLPNRLLPNPVCSFFPSPYNSKPRPQLTVQRAASVFAANTIVRSAVGAAFPLFSRQMFENLGVQWAGTLLGCLGAIMVPIPLVFIRLGPGLRAKSRYVPATATKGLEMGDGEGYSV